MVSVAKQNNDQACEEDRINSCDMETLQCEVKDLKSGIETQKQQVSMWYMYQGVVHKYFYPPGGEAAGRS